ncbi:MAG TPA: cupredoxin domain-containing protein [Gemmatimonadales bacterium]|nr:cupredoxin domain-containing protein [Gemmatimonadales bacterium]
MTTAELVVTFAGLAAILWVNWYFLLAGEAAAAGSAAGPQRFRIEVNNSYSPSAIRVRAGEPVQLDFHRTDRSSCTEEVVLPEFGIRRFLPTGQTTSVEFTPRAPGSYGFECGMGMVRGKIIAEEAES